MLSRHLAHFFKGSWNECYVQTLTQKEKKLNIQPINTITNIHKRFNTIKREPTRNGKWKKKIPGFLTEMKHSCNI